MSSSLYSSRAVSGLAACAAAVWLAALPCARAAAPDWLRAAAGAAATGYPESAVAVMLLEEEIATVKDSGDMTTLRRRVYKILRPQGRAYATFAVPFDKETRIGSLGGWSISPHGKEQEVKAKDAVETNFSNDMLYADARRKVLTIPGAEPGAVIGYEYEQKERPNVLQRIWWFQQEVPVRRARLTLQLPGDWEYRGFWRNYAPREPRPEKANRWVWELENVPAIDVEPAMPPPHAVTGALALSCFSTRQGASRSSHASWRDIGQWYHQLTADRRAPTPEIRQKVAEITAGETALLGKIRRLAEFAQRDIRYVAIEIGIGSHQPHEAREVFAGRYGDCKDKVTLLAAMLQAIGVDSYYLLAHTERGVVNRAFPTGSLFNHVISAIKLARDAETDRFDARLDHPSLGRLLLFDPTQPMTPFGSLPAGLQANSGLLVTAEGGELLDLPLAPASANRLGRAAKLKLSAEGSLSGEVVELYWGEMAAERRGRFQATPGLDRAKQIESFLSVFVEGKLEKAWLENLADAGSHLGVRYQFTAANYAKKAGDLLLVRPRVVGHKSGEVPAAGRKYPIEFSAATQESDQFEISLPEGCQVEELPPPVTAEYAFGRYTSATEVSGNLIRYKRLKVIQQVQVPAERLADLAEFYRKIAADERRSVVLRLAAR